MMVPDSLMTPEVAERLAAPLVHVAFLLSCSEAHVVAEWFSSLGELVQALLDRKVRPEAVVR